jgi:hypothetical protein
MEIREYLPLLCCVQRATQGHTADQNIVTPAPAVGYMVSVNQTGLQQFIWKLVKDRVGMESATLASPVIMGLPHIPGA